MTRSELVDALAGARNLPRSTAERVVDVVFDTMAEALTAGNRVEVRGLGSFQVKQYGGYTGRNPRTGTPVLVKPKTLPVFRVGKELREKLVDSKTGEERT